MTSVYRISFMLPSNSVPGMLDFLATHAIFNLELQPTNAELPEGVKLRRPKSSNGYGSRAISQHRTAPVHGAVKKAILDMVAKNGPMTNKSIAEELMRQGYSSGASSIANLVATRALVRTEDGLALSPRQARHVITGRRTTLPPPKRTGRPPVPPDLSEKPAVGIIPEALLKELASGPKDYRELLLALRSSPATLRNRSNFRRELTRLIANGIVEQTAPGVYQLIATTTTTTGGTIGGEEDERHAEAL